MKLEAIRDDVELSTIDPDEVALLLQRVGLQQRGGRPDVYSRWVLPTNEADHSSALVESLILPLNRGMADYTELLSGLLASMDRLAVRGNEAIRNALERLVLPPGDEYKFRKETPARAGAIPWSMGEDLFAAARGVLVAGAKARVLPQAYFGNRSSSFARRYLDSVLMGQTEVGSYVVTAFAPSREVFPVSESAKRQSMSQSDEYTGRDVTRTILQSLEASVEAVEHFHKTGSLSAFEDGVKRGLSRELAVALQRLTADSDYADVAVEVSAETTLLGRTEPETEKFEFAAKDYAALEKAAVRLAASEEPQHLRVTGWLSLVARPRRGEAGVVHMKVLEGSEARTLQVRLTEEQFEAAAAAIAADRAVTMNGRQEKEGNRHWLYDVDQVEPASEDGDLTGLERATLFDKGT